MKCSICSEEVMAVTPPAARGTLYWCPKCDVPERPFKRRIIRRKRRRKK